MPTESPGPYKHCQSALQHPTEFPDPNKLYKEYAPAWTKHDNLPGHLLYGRTYPPKSYYATPH